MGRANRQTTEPGNSYRIQGLIVREYRGIKYLSTARDECRIEETEEIADVQQESFLKLLDVTIIGIKNFEDAYRCKLAHCKGKVEECDGEVGKCLQCGLLVSLDQPKQLAIQFIAKAAGEVRTTELKAFGKTVAEIAETTVGEVNCKTLLTAKPFNVFFSEDGTIQSINREQK